MFKKIIVFLLGILFCILLLEFSLRIIGYINNFRPETYDNRHGKRVILCVGDSFTYSAGVADGLDYPSYLNSLLGEEKYRVINKGMPTCNTAMLLKRLPKWLSLYKPYLTIVQIGQANYWNFRDYSSKNNKNIRFFDILTEHIRSLRLLKLILIKFGFLDYGNNNVQDVLFDSLKKERNTIPFYEPENILKKKNSFLLNKFNDKKWFFLKNYELKKALDLFSSGDSSEDKLGKAICYFRQKHFDKARVLFENNKDDNNLKNYFISWYCRTLIEQGRLFKALSILRKNRFTLFKDDCAYEFCMALLYLKIKNYSLSIKWFHKVIESSPDFGESYYIIGKIYTNMFGGFEKEAIENFKKGIKNAPDYPENILILLDVMLKNGYSENDLKDMFYNIENNYPNNAFVQTKYAMLLNNNCIKNRKDPVLMLEKVIKNNPDYLPAYSAIIDILIEKKNLKRASQYCKTALKIFPESPQLIIFSGNIAYESGNMDIALENYLKISEHASPEILIKIAQILKEKGDLKSASSYLKKVLLINRTIKKTYFMLGEIKEQLGDEKEALSIYNDGCENAESSKCAWKLYEYYKKINNPERKKYYLKNVMNRGFQSIEHFREVLEASKSLFGEKESLYFVYKISKIQQNSQKVCNFIDSYFKKKENRQFLKEFEKKLDDYIHQMNLINTGYSYLELNNYNSAEITFRKALKYKSNKALSYFCIGSALRRQKYFIEAVDYFKKALKLEKKKNFFIGLIFTYNDNLMDTENEEKVLLEAMSYFPFDNELKKIMAEHYFDKKDYRKSQKYYYLAGMKNEGDFLKSFINSGKSTDFDLTDKVNRLLIKDYSKIVTLCRENGSFVLFQNYPEDENKVMEEFVKKNNIMFNDNYDKFSRLWKKGEIRDEYFLIGDDHCSPKGNLQTAKNLIEEMRKNGLF